MVAKYGRRPIHFKYDTDQIGRPESAIKFGDWNMDHLKLMLSRQNLMNTQMV